MTNREVHELAAGMGLEDMFFRMNNIDPDAVCNECKDCSCNKCEDTYCKSEACYESCTVYKKSYPYNKCPNED